MKRLLATTAIATMAFTGAASAQSLLERVLQDVGSNLGDVTGVFANTADNLLAGAVPDTTTIGGTARTEDRTVDEGDVIVIRVDPAGGTNFNDVVVTVGEDGELRDANGDLIGTVVLGATLLTNNAGSLTVDPANLSPDDNEAFAALANAEDFSVATITTTVGGDVFSTSGINASVSNILRGLDGPTAVTEFSSATDAVEALIGNIATTALGAVNTGEITLIGTNQSFDEKIDQAIAGTSDALQQRINHTITQVGTTADQTMLAINSALNETNVNASVLNAMTGVNATIGRSGFELELTDEGWASMASMDADAIAALTGGISTTALGAVNTGSIVSGANDQVNGVVSSIVGNAATSTN